MTARQPSRLPTRVPEDEDEHAVLHALLAVVGIKTKPYNDLLVSKLAERTGLSAASIKAHIRDLDGQCVDVFDALGKIYVRGCSCPGQSTIPSVGLPDASKGDSLPPQAVDRGPRSNRELQAIDFELRAEKSIGKPTIPIDKGWKRQVSALNRYWIETYRFNAPGHLWSVNENDMKAVLAGNFKKWLLDLCIDPYVIVDMVDTFWRHVKDGSIETTSKTLPHKLFVKMRGRMHNEVSNRVSEEQSERWRQEWEDHKQTL